jgi:hypothetical protein
MFGVIMPDVIHDLDVVHEGEVAIRAEMWLVPVCHSSLLSRHPLLETSGHLHQRAPLERATDPKVPTLEAERHDAPGVTARRR